MLLAAPVAEVFSEDAWIRIWIHNPDIGNIDRRGAPPGCRHPSCLSDRLGPVEVLVAPMYLPVQSLRKRGKNGLNGLGNMRAWYRSGRLPIGCSVPVPEKSKGKCNCTDIGGRIVVYHPRLLKECSHMFGLTEGEPFFGREPGADHEDERVERKRLVRPNPPLVHRTREIDERGA